MLTTKLGHRNAAFGLAQDRKDLGFAVSRHLHLNLLMHLVEANSTSAAPYFRGGITATTAPRFSIRAFVANVVPWMNPPI